MERLTYRDETGKAWAKLSTSVSSEKALNFGRLSLDRLASYEDTGLEPSEIEQMQEKVDHLAKQLSGYVKQCLHYESELARLREADRHGRWMPELEEMDYMPDGVTSCGIRKVQTGWVCSICGRNGYSEPEDMPYCHCGARMDKEAGR